MKIEQWELLDSSQQDTLLSKYRDPCDHEWWDCVYDQFKETCSGLGIEVTGITFSGFWSQGDGAAFDGYVREWSTALMHLERPAYLKWASEYDWGFNSSTNRSNCMRFHDNLPGPECPYDEDEEPLQSHAWLARYQPPTEKELDELFDLLKNWFEELADQLYKDLEEEYEYLTSDKTTLDYILDNVEWSSALDDLDLDDEEREELEAANSALAPPPEPEPDRQMALF